MPKVKLYIQSYINIILVDIKYFCQSILEQLITIYFLKIQNYYIEKINLLF